MGKSGKAWTTGWDQYIQHYKVSPSGKTSDLRDPEKALKQRKVQLEALKAHYQARAKYIADYGPYLE